MVTLEVFIWQVWLTFLISWHFKQTLHIEMFPRVEDVVDDFTLMLVLRCVLGEA